MVFGVAALFGRDVFGGDAEYFGGGAAVYVFAVLERGNEGFVAGEVRHDAQLDLGVVGGNDNAALRCGEGSAYAAAFGGADGDVCRLGLLLARRPVMATAWA